MSTLTPHGACLLWKPELIWLNAVSDAILAGAFFAIAFVVGLFVWRRRDIMYRGVFGIFAIFAMVCGITRLLSILTLWVPAYDIEGLTKGFLALISLGITAALLLSLPRILVQPSRTQLQQANAALEEEIRTGARPRPWSSVFRRSRPTRPRSGKRRRWKPSANSPVVLRTTSTTF